jgi:hypothetical protein
MVVWALGPQQQAPAAVFSWQPGEGADAVGAFTTTLLIAAQERASAGVPPMVSTIARTSSSESHKLLRLKSTIVCIHGQNRLNGQCSPFGSSLYTPGG